MRFRRELVKRRLDAPLFRAVVRQLETRGLVVKTGTLVDATIIGAASKGDGEATWSKYAKRPAVKGYKAHIATDRDGSIVRRVSVTPANVHDSNGLEDVLPYRPGEVFADAAYQGLRVATAIRQAKGRVRIVRSLHGRSPDGVNEVKAAWNAAIRPVRCRVEKVFGTVKRSYGLTRARYLGQARVSLQVHLTMLAYNLKRAVTLERERVA